MANYETITNKVFLQENANNRSFVKQIYTFKDPNNKKNDDEVKTEEIHDDNIDCLNNCIIAYKSHYRLLGTIFEN